jgi:uncharacterized protein involved in response to NO
MAYGLFGGFIFGFVETAMPRMLSAKPFTRIQESGLLTVYAAMMAFYAAARIAIADVLFLILMLFFGICIAPFLESQRHSAPRLSTRVARKC